MNFDSEIQRLRAEAESRSVNELLAEAHSHMTNAANGVAPLGSVSGAIFLLEVVRSKLAKEAVHGN